MSNQIELTTKYISALSPVAIATDKNIGEHAVNKFTAMYQVPKQQAVAYWERQKDNFMKRISDSEDLKACTSLSIFMSLMQGFGWSLSFEGGEQMEIYLIVGNRNIAPKNEQPKWIKECVAQPSPYGKKKIRIQNGQIKSTGEPTIVYQGDTYEEFTDDNGKTKVVWKKGNRGDNPVIIGSFIRIEKPDGSHEFVTFDMEDVKSWQAASAKKNKDKGANSLYTSNNGQIDKLFFEGKTLTHAFKGYPKVISVPRLPETFVPDEKIGMRQGLDVSEFTEDITYTEATEVNEPSFDNQEEFAKALKEESPVSETIIISGNEDEPGF